MSSPTTFTVPAGMSCVNAFYALWENSKPAAFWSFHVALQSPPATTAEKVADLFKIRTHFDYEGGRALKISFANFPKLDACLYDRDFGAGTAQKVIEKYNSVHSSERFDKNDSFKFEELTKK